MQHILDKVKHLQSIGYHISISCYSKSGDYGITLFHNTKWDCNDSSTTQYNSYKDNCKTVEEAFLYAVNYIEQIEGIVSYPFGSITQPSTLSQPVSVNVPRTSNHDKVEVVVSSVWGISRKKESY